MDIKQLGISEEEIRGAAKKEIERRQRATRLITDPFLFHRDVLCKPEWRDCLAPIHQEGLDFINQGKRKKLILWPRKHLKSTIFTQGESLRRAILDPDIRILISSAKHDNAKRFLSAIKGYLREPRFIELYGSLLPGSRDKYCKDNDAELTLVSRRNLSLKEPTFSTTGLDAAQTSQHYDLIIHDDLVERKNVGTTDMMDKVILYYKDSLDLLDPGMELWVLGTRWHPMDLYGWIAENFCDPRCVENGFEHVNKCRCDFDVTFREIKEEGSYVFPARFNDEEADVLLRMKGRREYAAQYLNNPYDPSVCWFHQNDVDAALISPEEIAQIAGKLIWYILVDPAESLENRSSYTAGVVFGVDPSTGIWYVDAAEAVRVDTPGLIDLCFDLVRKYPTAQFGLETNTRKANVYCLKEKMYERGLFFNITDLNPMKPWAGGDVKEQRIKRLQPLFEFKRIRVNRFLKDLIQVLCTAPASKSLDLPDALSYGLDLVPPGLGGGDPDQKPPRRTIGWKGTGL